MTEHIKCLIIGSGPAGYTAAIYAGRANLSPVLYQGIQAGGQLTQTTEIENFPGFPQGIDANQLMSDMQEQAARFGADIRDGEVTKISLGSKPYKVTIDDEKDVTADSIIIATGAKAKYLGLPDEEKYKGMGVSGCATCDGFFYRKKTVAVVGGGDTACEDALYLSKICKKVYLLVRKNYLRASEIMQKRVKEDENIEILFEHNVSGIFGNGAVEGINVVKRKGESNESNYQIAVDGLFLAIGHKPATDIFDGQLVLDNNGFIVTAANSQSVVSSSTKQAIDGVFAAGDVCDPVYRQAIVAAGSGCKAALEAEKYLLMQAK
ncbi:MAG: thioredoxin-disulfide reductase [Paludibacteraceae bacterium]|nr:thioredoxin-disulfide reductase [Paludibacteraceae bacterium]